MAMYYPSFHLPKQTFENISSFIHWNVTEYSVFKKKVWEENGVVAIFLIALRLCQIEHYLPGSFSTT